VAQVALGNPVVLEGSVSLAAQAELDLDLGAEPTRVRVAEADLVPVAEVDLVPVAVRIRSEAAVRHGVAVAVVLSAGAAVE
jgi:hypothetical protein